MDAMSRPPIDTSVLVRIAPTIRVEMHKCACAGAVTAVEAIKHVFRKLFGDDRSREDEIRFMVYVAPLARQIAVELANPTDHIKGTNIRVQDLREWLGWLDAFDPLCARMVDLHYFAELSIKETAFALKLPVTAVTRDLRFAKAWLQTKLI